MFLLNGVFHLLHIIIILSSLTLFLFDDFVVIHLWLQAIILSSWLIIGPLMNKPGICLLTEVQKKMGLGGDNDFPSSYMFYLVKKFGYKGSDSKKVDLITFAGFSVCTLISVIRFIYL